MLPPGLTSAREVTLHYNGLYAHLISTNQAHPFLYPQATLGALLVLLYLVLDHRNKPLLRWLRYPVFGFLCVFQGWCILFMRARNPAAAFGVGLLSSWGLLWVSAIMVVQDCQSDFLRLEQGTPAVVAKANGNAQEQNDDDDAADERAKEAAYGIYWQSYPTSFLSRLDWIADAFSNFRGLGWNWQTSGIPPLPAPHRTRHNDRTPGVTKSKTGIRRFSSRPKLLRTTLLNLTLGYLALDLIKTLMTHDPYFWGYTLSPAPAYLPDSLRASPALTKSYRLALSLAGVYTALHTIFALGPLFFTLVLPPSVFGLRTSPLLNPPDMFGSFSSNVLELGLAGWWGGFWHQTFRAAFESHSLALLHFLQIEKTSTPRKLLSLFTAFFLSGCLHACGSYTQLGSTRPLAGPMRFFLLQALGIAVQSFFLLPRVKRMHRFVRWGMNLGFTLGWLFYTAPLLVDDFAKGGVWLFEPIAVSPLRAMGFGAEGEGGWCWWDGIVWWRRGDGWWDTGLAA